MLVAGTSELSLAGSEYQALYNTPDYSLPPTRLSEGLAGLNPKDPFAGATLRLWDPNVRPAISQHLRVLGDAGLVACRRDGRHRYYRARRTELGPLRTWLEQMWARSSSRRSPPTCGFAIRTATSRSRVVDMNPHSVASCPTNSSRSATSKTALGCLMPR